MIHSTFSFVQLILFAICLYVIFAKVQSNLWKGVLFVVALLCTFIAHGLLPDLILIGIAMAITANDRMNSRF